MDTFGKVYEEINDLLPDLNESQKLLLREKVEEANQAELSKPPVIAIIGPTGVGKSSTINALFGTQLSVSHTKAETSDAEKIIVEEFVEGKKGSIVIYDMPGIGEDIKKDEEYKKTYAKVLANSDVAIWVMSAHDRRITKDKEIMRDVISVANSKVLSKLVIALNKVDLVWPQDWIEKINLPSEEQEENTKERIKDIHEKLKDVCPHLTKDRIVPYSAKQKYHLRNLFGAMMEACSPGRAWVLKSREQITDPEEDIAEKIFAELGI